MSYFWEGFEKRAGFKDWVKKLIPKAKPLAEGVKKKQTYREATREAIDNINEAAKGLKSGVTEIREHIPGVKDVVKEQGESLRKAVGEKSDLALKYLKRGGLGVLGLYGAGQAASVPGAYHRYQYYKANQELANKRLQDRRKQGG